MSGIGERLDAEWHADLARLRRMTHHTSDPSQQEEHMTETTTTAPAPPAASFFQAFHHDLDAISRYLPRLRDIATEPWLDTLIEAGLAAAGQPEADAVFTGAVAILRAHGSGQNVGDVILDLLRTVMHKPAAPASPAAVASFTPAGQGSAAQVVV